MWFLQGRCVYQRILIYSTSFGTLSNLSINAEFELCDRIQLLPLEGNAMIIMIIVMKRYT